VGKEERVADGLNGLLTAILQTLQEGVIVCDSVGRILFANQAVQKFFRNRNVIEAGRSIYDACTRESIEQTLDFLRQRQGRDKQVFSEPGGEPFACAITETGLLVNCRLSLLPPAAGLTAGFVMLFAPGSQNKGSAKQAGSSLSVLMEGLRSPLANLRAAAESLISHPEMAPVMRSAFENIIAQESVALSAQFETMAEECRALALKQTFLVDIYSKDVIDSLRHAFRNKTGPAFVEIGTPHWLRADSLLLLRSLIFFVERIIDLYPVSLLEIETVAKAQRIYLDFIWAGEPVPAAEIESWRSQELLDENMTAISVAEVLERHNSDVWSSFHERPGRAMVRVPLPVSSRQGG
jgi:DNA polymerase-3 subunit epsilon